MSLEDRVRGIHEENPDWGWRRVSGALGIYGKEQRRVRRILDNIRGKSMSAIQSQDWTRTPSGNQVVYENGNYKIERIVSLSQDELLDPTAIMKAVGLDPLKFELVSFRYGEHQGLAKIDETIETKTLYNLRVIVRPMKRGIDWDEVVNRLSALKPRAVSAELDPVPGTLLEVAITDAHFGLNTYEDYKKTLESILGLMDSQEDVVLIMGSDNLHTNSADNKTINGTQLETTDLEKAYEDCMQFYMDIIEHGLINGSRIHLVYLPANHDRDLSWSMAKAFERIYPDGVQHYSNMDQYKALRFGGVALGFTHGDKGKACEYDRIFMAEHPEVFARASTAEIHSGHIHTETAKDLHGVMVRSLPSATKRNGWTKRNGYHGVQRFQLFEYSRDELKAIYYV